MHPGPAPVPVTVSPSQQAVLTALLRRTSCPQALALRARVILGAAASQRNEPLARQASCTPNTVRKWRSRWADADGPALERAIAAALADAPRSGTPATFTAEQIVQILNLACSSPAQFRRPVDAWTPGELADEAIQQGIVATISPRSVERFLKGGRSAAPSQPLLAQRQGQAGRS